jgi:3-hydroxy-9,10-secoandrosta-1,3,5(10)-triene-9,17-dione monooxygenase
VIPLITHSLLPFDDYHSKVANVTTKEPHMTLFAESDRSTRLVQRAKAVVPSLRSRAEATSSARRLPKENIADLRTSGAMKTIQSTNNGGYGLGMREHLDVVSTIAEGCGATAWVLGVVHAHSWLMSHFSAQAQKDSYGANPDAMISAVIGPRGTATRVEGGYALTGTWPFTSGCENADWLLLGGVIRDGDKVLDEGDFLIPISEVTLLDDWHTVGLSGTGSCTSTVTNLFIPEHRFLSLPSVIMGAAPGTADQQGWNHRAAAVPVLSLALCGPAIGIAKSALADFPAIIQGKTIAYTRDDQYNHPNTHRMVADAAHLIHEGELILYRVADEIDQAARVDEEIPFLTRARIRLSCAQGVRRCLEGVEILFKASGASGIRTSNPLTRAVADLRAINQHGLLNLEMNQELYGRVLLGLAPNSPLI